MAGQARKAGVIDTGRSSSDVQSAIATFRSLDTSERLLALYGLGIEGCARRNPEQVTAVVEELMGTLDFAYAEIAEGFQRVYQYCLERARDGDFDQVAFVLQDLHDTLESAVSESAPSAKADAS
jgi:hypothetical protein